LCQAQAVPDVVFLNGTVGAGKTTVAAALSDYGRSHGRQSRLVLNHG
jgi:tRNA A37 threonylcarbamoyladenosine biosynthesis protein TsaE